MFRILLDYQPRSNQVRKDGSITEQMGAPSLGSRRWRKASLPRALQYPLLRECLIFSSFLLLTALMTWPWVKHLRYAVSDQGDPYMIAWTLWWDYHQTFTDPLSLFHANVFYPYQYTLAFSEHVYGIALLFFPLFALGCPPLTVHSIATFLSFTFCGYGAFRLARTLTGSTGAGFVAGIVFAFIPYRFSILPHLHYMFAGWIPLLLEALVLFARARSWKRAAWLGVAFLMNALTCVTWFILTLPPLALSLLFLVVRYSIIRDAKFWVRGAVAVGAASLVLIPFLLPYYYVHKLNNFMWERASVEQQAPPLVSWVSGEQRNKVWRTLGRELGGKALFPGLLPLLLALITLLFVEPVSALTSATPKINSGSHRKWLLVLDGMVILAGIFALLAVGYGVAGPALQRRIFSVKTIDRALMVLLLALTTRFCLEYPQFLQRALGKRNLLETIRTSPRGDAVGLGLIWTVTGFLMSLGMNNFFYRFLYDHVFSFRSLRGQERAAMLCYVGLAVLAGRGALLLGQFIRRRRARTPVLAVYAVMVVALLCELSVIPLPFERGATWPDELTRRLKDTPMRGGLLELPTGRDRGYEHRYVLRAADHGRPLINSTSSFIPKIPEEIERLTQATPIPTRLLDLLEAIPASYVVVHHNLIPPERRPHYETFLAQAVCAGQLRFIRRYGTDDDLYAVTKTEPTAQQETEMARPFIFDCMSYRQ